MAKQYYAVNRIRVGRAPEEDLVFEPDQQVTGLDKDQMIELWNAGVLREVDPDNTPADARDVRIAQLEAQIAQLEAEKQAAQEAKEAEPPPAELPQNPTPTSGEAAAGLVGTIGDPNPQPVDETSGTEEKADGPAEGEQPTE